MLTTAVKAARKAGGIITRASADLDKLTVRRKRQNDFVSEVDHAAEEAIISILSHAYPSHGFLADESGKLVDASGKEQEINPNQAYTIITIDYLMRLNSGAYAILQEGKNPRPLNVTLRDAVMNYVKGETAAGRTVRGVVDNRFVQVGPGPKNAEAPR